MLNFYQEFCLRASKPDNEVPFRKDPGAHYQGMDQSLMANLEVPILRL